jgi:translation initiation factor IF-2
MRFGGFQFALLALALSACADSDKPIAGFDTITVEVPPQATPAPQTTPTASQNGKVEPAIAPAPARKPAPVAVAKTPSQPKRRTQTARAAPPPRARKQLARETTASATLTPEDIGLRPQPEPQPKAAPKPLATPPALPAMVQEDAQGRTVITPRTQSVRQTAICNDVPQAVCKELTGCRWTDTHTIEPGVYVKGHCESK